MLVNKIDAIVASQPEKKLASVVNFVGEDTDKAKEKIKKFGDKHRWKKAPLAIITDGEDLKIDDAAEVTVMLYLGKKIKFNYALPKGGLTQKTVAAIVQDTKKLLEMPAETPKEKEKPKEGKSKTKPSAQQEPKPPIKKDAA